MADEIYHNDVTGLTLYACRFAHDGDVFVTSGASSEVWGTGARAAGDYDVALTEQDACGHYLGDFDASGNIAAGVYRIAVYQQLGASPADSDPPIAQGELCWDGNQEITDSFALLRLRRSLGAWH